MKKVIFACVDQVLEFDSEQEVDKFLEHLDSRKQQFKVLWRMPTDTGKVRIRIKKQYNNHFMEGGDEE